MDNSNLGNLMETTMQNIKNMVDVNTVVGDPIFTPDGITLVPVSRVSFGFGGGGAEFAQSKGYGGGTGCGVRVEPIGFLVVKDGNVRMSLINALIVAVGSRSSDNVSDTFKQLENIWTEHGGANYPDP